MKSQTATNGLNTYIELSCDFPQSHPPSHIRLPDCETLGFGNGWSSNGTTAFGAFLLCPFHASEDTFPDHGTFALQVHDAAGRFGSLPGNAGDRMAWR